MLRLLLAGVAGFVVLSAASAVASPSRVIQGSQKIGAFSTYRDHGKLAHAVAAFGRPASLVSRRARYDCTAHWPGLGLTMTFNGVCAAGSCFIRADISRPPWRTAKGLNIGDSLGRLRRLYPKARPRDGLEALLIEPALEGTIVSLGAKLASGKVAAFRVYPCCPCEA